MLCPTANPATLTAQTASVSIVRAPCALVRGALSAPLGKIYAHSPAAATGIVAQNGYRMEDAPISAHIASSSAPSTARFWPFSMRISRAVMPTHRFVSTACGT